MVPIELELYGTQTSLENDVATHQWWRVTVTRHATFLYHARSCAACRLSIRLWYV